MGRIMPVPFNSSASEFMISDHTIDTFPQLSSLKVRRQTPGKEQTLVQEFLEQLQSTEARNNARTVFIEPRIESGFPDIVIVEWDAARAAVWPWARSQLKRTDIRFLHGLYIENSDVSVVSKRWSGAGSILRRLEKVGIISNDGISWKLRPLREIFAVERIIAIEAKINALSSGLQQAMINTWFASESYLLLPRIGHDHPIREEAKKYGVQVITASDTIPESHDSVDDLPRSYVSWMFNEWSWRATLS